MNTNLNIEKIRKITQNDKANAMLARHKNAAKIIANQTRTSHMLENEKNFKFKLFLKNN